MRPSFDAEMEPIVAKVGLRGLAVPPTAAGRWWR